MKNELYLLKNIMPLKIQTTFLPVSFNQAFSHDVEDPRYRIKINLEKEIISTELPGIFNKVLAAMSKLIANGRFSDSDKLKNTMKEFELDNNNVYRFAHDMVAKDPTVAFISIQTLYDNYQEWCKSEGSQAKSKVNFGKDFKEYMKIDSKVVKVHGVSVRGYECLKIVKPEENEEEFRNEEPHIKM